MNHQRISRAHFARSLNPRFLLDPVEEAFNGLADRTHQPIVIALVVVEFFPFRLLYWRNQSCALLFQVRDDLWCRVSQIAEEFGGGYFRLLPNEGFRVVMRGRAQPYL